MRLAPVALAALLAACAPREPHPVPAAGERIFAVLPFVVPGDSPLSGEEMAALMCNEVAKVPGFRALRPTGKGPRSVEEALALGRGLGADSVLAVAVTDQDPYLPPRMSVSVQVLRVAPRKLEAADVDRLVRSASWRRGPLPLTREGSGQLLASFEEVYDTRGKRTRARLAAYAETQVDGDSGFTGDREYLMNQSRFVQFVCAQVLKRIVETAGGPLEP